MYANIDATGGARMELATTSSSTANDGADAGSGYYEATIGMSAATAATLGKKEEAAPAAAEAKDGESLHYATPNKGKKELLFPPSHLKSLSSPQGQNDSTHT